MQSLDGLVDGQIVIGATNRRDRLDKALLRRFQRQVEFKPFDKEERQAMIEVYMNSVDSHFSRMKSSIMQVNLTHRLKS